MTERNEKKKKEKKKRCRTWMGYCPLSMRLGAGLGAGQAWAQAGRAAGALARRWAAGVRGWACWGALGVRVREDGCAGCVARSGRVGGRELGACAGARRRAGARGRASGHAAGRTVRAGHGRASWASWARLGFCAL